MPGVVELQIETAPDEFPSVNVKSKKPNTVSKKRQLVGWALCVDVVSDDSDI